MSLMLAVFTFSDSIPTEITENTFIVRESILRKKIFNTSLYLGEIVLFWGWGAKRAIRAVTLHLARSGTQSELGIRRILPARGAWQFA